MSEPTTCPWVLGRIYLVNDGFHWFSGRLIAKQLNWHYNFADGKIETNEKYVFGNGVAIFWPSERDSVRETK